MKTGPSSRGFTLIEVLICLVILAFGMLALARAMANATLDELESFQRSQAMVIAQEMIERMNANRKEAIQYVGDYTVPSVASDCALEARSSVSVSATPHRGVSGLLFHPGHVASAGPAARRLPSKHGSCPRGL